MKKWFSALLVAVLALSLAACGATDTPAESPTISAENSETSEETLTISTETTDIPEEFSDIPVDPSIELSGDRIRYHKYDWGTSFEEIKNNEITDGMVQGQDYGYFDSGITDFSKELIVDGTLFGSYFAVHYYFDQQDQLVSVMPVQGLILSDLEVTELFLEAVEYYTDLYGAPDNLDSLKTVESFSDISQYTSWIAEGNSVNYIWTDDDLNQLIVSCYKGNHWLELVIIFNTKDYVM